MANIISVLKFGGTSVGTTGSIEKLIQIVMDEKHKDTAVVVVSAFSGITDALIDTARTSAGGGGYEEKLKLIKQRHYAAAEHFLSGGQLEDANSMLNSAFDDLTRILDGISLLKELSARSLDRIMSFGERLSASLIARFFSAKGKTAEYLDSRLLIKTNDQYGKAVVNFDATDENIKNYLKTHSKLQIAAGFIASTEDGTTTTLGRGGSDYSAAIYGAALDAGRVEIWTDVDGILTTDPKMVKNAFTIDEISYTEAVEMSHFGAKVLYPPTVAPLMKKNIPISIKNTFNPQSNGTLISRTVSKDDQPIRGISSLGNIALVRVQGTGMVGMAGFSSRLFGAIAGKNINVILISQASSEYSICFAVSPDDAEAAEAVLCEEFAREIDMSLLEKPIVERNLAIIAVVGSYMKSTSGISGKVFYALGRNGVNVVAISQGSSEINISTVIEKNDVAKALNSIHEAFFLSTVRTVNLFLVGCGLIGGTLLKQIEKQRETLAVKDQIRINIIGAANSRNMVFDMNGIEPASVLDRLKEGEAFNISDFVQKMTCANLPNSCFCDCTSSEDIALAYESILKGAIAIVTPNKKANSGSFDYYKRLTNYSRARGIPYLYEVTVCAGLPVISTLRDLYLSGDKVERIEAVLSGTLSFIFNNFDGTKPFSVLVREAKAKGYTEPDPRDDLNAMDAARKALILARECGMQLEFSQVSIEPILPEACFKADSVESFFKELEKADADFEKRRAKAAGEAKSLRYVACIEEGKATLSIREEAATSPFLSLSDSDNIVVISTVRYSKLPMVIKGPGAGAEVTAGGVFADIVRIARAPV
ncbi:MAG: bifunctional aspartate kinase/homoserine dehydrogenase I [Spirochaetaceae bacterium]|jgi:aspartokinase/homoserine dehydrogenase 1|nr:bifunctional aspartate kinase/homoserine dehydrogenase I [Spirochaetaceae bacterium]